MYPDQKQEFRSCVLDVLIKYPPLFVGGDVSSCNFAAPAPLPPVFHDTDMNDNTHLSVCLRGMGDDGVRSLHEVTLKAKSCSLHLCHGKACKTDVEHSKVAALFSRDHEPKSRSKRRRCSQQQRSLGMRNQFAQSLCLALFLLFFGISPRPISGFRRRSRSCDQPCQKKPLS